MRKKYNINCPTEKGDQVLLENNQTLESAADMALKVAADGYLESRDYKKRKYDPACITVDFQGG
ncbi:MAG: hypothetical protein WBA13_01240 [Microcoleaceae cyanobacterium]